MQHKLYALRKQAGLTQKDMADKLGISPFTYRNKETSKVAFTADEMFAISKLFDKDIEEIFLPRKSPIW